MSSSSTTTTQLHRLRHKWVLFQHKKTKIEDYKKNTKRMFEIYTVEDFWRKWQSLPIPSELFYSSDNDARAINGYSLFKDKIFPEWEDPANHDGKEWCSESVYAESVDRLWENLVIGCLAELIENNDEICGCRVVQKPRTKKNPNVSCKLQLWLRNCSDETADSIKARMIEVLKEPPEHEEDAEDGVIETDVSLGEHDKSDELLGSATAGGGSSSKRKSSVIIPEFELNLRI